MLNIILLGGGPMINIIDPVVLDLTEQLEQIIRELQLAREEFVALEARMAAREEEICH